MQLLEFSEIEAKLEQFFLEVPEDIRLDLSDLRLKKSNLSNCDLLQLETLLRLKLPNTFRHTILEYDFGDLTLGGVWFGYQNDNYIKYLIENNIDRNESKYLEIANSDGHIILLDTETDKIMAYSRNSSREKAEFIATNFEVFVKAIATIFIKNQEGIDKYELSNIPLIIGSVARNFFWEEIIGS